MWSNIRNSLWTHGLGCLQETERMKKPWCTHTHTFSESLKPGISFSRKMCWKEPGFCQDPNRNSFNTQISWQSLHPTNAGTLSAQKGRGKTVSRVKGGRKYSAFNRSLWLLALARWMEGQCQALGNKKPLTSLQVSTSRDVEEAQGPTALSLLGMALKPKLGNLGALGSAELSSTESLLGQHMHRGTRGRILIFWSPNTQPSKAIWLRGRVLTWSSQG